MKKFLLVLAAVCSIFVLAIVLVVGGLGLKAIGLGGAYVGNAMDTAFAELNPARLLEKYEWFKDASAQLDSKIATFQQYSVKIGQMEADYEGVSRNDWARDDRQQLSMWRTELDGLATAYNNLAAEYNAQMAKINYRFTNIGMLPEGATQTVPREYRQYLAGGDPAGLRVTTPTTDPSLP